MNKEIEIKVDENLKVDLSEVIQMKTEYELLIKKLKEENNDLTTVYLKGYEDGKEKYNHYKLLYQKVKERNDKAIEYIKEHGCYEEDTKVFCVDLNYYAIPRLLDILEGNNETQ